MRKIKDFSELQPLTNTSLMWYINQLSYIEGKLKGRRIKTPHKGDMVQVMRELNETVNELFV